MRRRERGHQFGVFDPGGKVRLVGLALDPIDQQGAVENELALARRLVEIGLVKSPVGTAFRLTGWKTVCQDAIERSKKETAKKSAAKKWRRCQPSRDFFDISRPT